MFTMSFDTDNDAFQLDDTGELDLVAVADVVATIAGKVERWDGHTKFQPIYDPNGNRIGQWKLAPEEARP
jgi:hypothetical protein